MNSNARIEDSARFGKTIMNTLSWIS